MLCNGIAILPKQVGNQNRKSLLRLAILLANSPNFITGLVTVTELFVLRLILADWAHHKTIISLSYSHLCLLLIKYFWWGCFVPPRLLRLGQLPPPSPRFRYAIACFEFTFVSYCVRIMSVTGGFCPVVTASRKLLCTLSPVSIYDDWWMTVRVIYTVRLGM